MASEQLNAALELIRRNIEKASLTIRELKRSANVLAATEGEPIVYADADEQIATGATLDGNPGRPVHPVLDPSTAARASLSRHRGKSPTPRRWMTSSTLLEARRLRLRRETMSTRRAKFSGHPGQGRPGEAPRQWELRPPGKVRRPLQHQEGQGQARHRRDLAEDAERRRMVQEGQLKV